jgi:hypothetical protein
MLMLVSRGRIAESVFFRSGMLGVSPWVGRISRAFSVLLPAVLDKAE